MLNLFHLSRLRWCATNRPGGTGRRGNGRGNRGARRSGEKATMPSAPPAGGVRPNRRPFKRFPRFLADFEDGICELNHALAMLPHMVAVEAVFSASAWPVESRRRNIEHGEGGKGRMPGREVLRWPKGPKKLLSCSAPLPPPSAA